MLMQDVNILLESRFSRMNCQMFSTGLSSGDFVLLADPGFVLPPNPYGRPWWEASPDFRHSGWEVFLNADMASGAWA